MALAVQDISQDVTEQPFRMASQEIVRRLVEVFGARFVALIGGVKNTRTVRHWLTGEKRPDQLDRLVFTLQVVLLMQSAGESNEVINAWFRGMNPRLEDDAPVLVIADKPLVKIQRNVMAAARAFLI